MLTTNLDVCRRPHDKEQQRVCRKPLPIFLPVGWIDVVSTYQVFVDLKLISVDRRPPSIAENFGLRLGERVLSRDEDVVGGITLNAISAVLLLGLWVNLLAAFSGVLAVVRLFVVIEKFQYMGRELRKANEWGVLWFSTHV